MYLFIDGGFLDSLISKTVNTYGVALSPLELRYTEFIFGFQRTFYYDAWPSRKNETEEEYKAIAVVAAAEAAAAKGDIDTAVNKMKGAGKWVWGVAKDVGATVAAKLIAQGLGLAG